ncbi:MULTISPECIES: hypothetical protein [Achromobacter]|uniref:hypothetical protein n=1 Tax=Achromobacter TaxID=222 RepID=UPI000C263E96|nr:MULTISPECIES: hypothetical protein [Achromobacter]PJM88723.1 hypothetical protein CV044_12990 [Achromobacter ruhlandii]BEG77385.1 hypothetical protein HBIAX_04474 [Achromobacter xylosoxidans]
MENAIARVYVNNVEVGAMPAAQYEAIVAEVFGNRWLRAREIVALGEVLLRSLLWAMTRLPAWLVGVLLVLAVGFPAEEWGPVIEYVRSTEAAALAQGMRTVLLPVLGLGVVLLVCWRFATAPDARSGLDREIDYRIRKVMECPTEGRLRVHVHKGDTVTVHGRQG